jgi:hypothetical protein
MKQKFMFCRFLKHWSNSMAFYFVFSEYSSLPTKCICTPVKATVRRDPRTCSVFGSAVTIWRESGFPWWPTSTTDTAITRYVFSLANLPQCVLRPIYRQWRRWLSGESKWLWVAKAKFQRQRRPRSTQATLRTPPCMPLRGTHWSLWTPRSWWWVFCTFAAGWRQNALTRDGAD